MILTRLQRGWEHLKKCWLPCLICTILMVGWQYSAGVPFLSLQTLTMVLVMPFGFAFFDFSYINYKNVRQKLSKRSQKIAMFNISFAFVLVTISTIYRDLFHTDALHYLIYCGVVALWLFLSFRCANKE